MVVVSRHAQTLGTRPTSLRAPACRGAAATEKMGEEIAGFVAVHRIGTTARELETGVPVGRRRERLTLAPALTHRVVGRTPFGIGQDGVGFVDLLHAHHRVGLLADVGVVLARQLAERLLDLLVGGIARHAEHLVVILELHGGGSSWSQVRCTGLEIKAS